MRRFLTPNWILTGAALLCLLLGWLIGQFSIGAIAAAGALCALAIRNPNWRLNLGGGNSLASDGAPAPMEDWTPPKDTPRPPTARREPSDGSLVEQMIAQGREALLLRPQIAANLSDTDLASAQVALDEAMAIVPQGAVNMRARCYEDLQVAEAPRGERLVQVEGFFLDRYPVTNGEYQQFVDDGGYEQMSLWDESIWPAVLGFVDSSGQPGPRFWENGKFPRRQGRSSGRRRLAGTKRPPSPAGWASGCRPIPNGSRPAAGRSRPRRAGPCSANFPGATRMDRRLVNLWGSGVNDTVSVTASPGAASVDGVQQLIGNVWEWTSSHLRRLGAGRAQDRNHDAAQEHSRRRVRHVLRHAGPAANSKAATARLARKHNIGFRCALGFCDVVLAGGGMDVSVHYRCQSCSRGGARMRAAGTSKWTRIAWRRTRFPARATSAAAATTSTPSCAAIARPRWPWPTRPTRKRSIRE